MAGTLLLILISCAASNAAPLSLAEYRARVERATIALDSLSSFDEEISRKERAARISQTLRGIRQALPPALTVEWNNGAVFQVNNSWLDDALKEYEKISSRDEQDGATHLRRITEQLHALGERLDEVLHGSAEGKRSKDEDKARLAAILRRAEYNKAAQESALSRLWARFKKWLRSLFRENEPSPPRQPAQPSAAFRGLAEIIVISLALAVIAYAVWKLLPRFLRNRGGRKRARREARVVLGERLAADETASDILDEAERLARAGDIRGAIRKGYIALLCELGDRKILSLAQHKTNRDYLRALADRRPLHSAMQQLTNTFENHWYGYAPGTENDWTAFRVHYKQALEEQG